MQKSREEYNAVLVKYRAPVLLAGAVLLTGTICTGDLFILHVYDKRYAGAAWMVAILAVGLWHTPSLQHIEPGHSCATEIPLQRHSLCRVLRHIVCTPARRLSHIWNCGSSGGGSSERFSGLRHLSVERTTGEDLRRVTGFVDDRRVCGDSRCRAGDTSRLLDCRCRFRPCVTRFLPWTIKRPEKLQSVTFRLCAPGSCSACTQWMAVAISARRRVPGPGCCLSSQSKATRQESLRGFFLWHLSLCLSCSATGDAEDRASGSRVGAFHHRCSSHGVMAVLELAHRREMVSAEGKATQARRTTRIVGDHDDRGGRQCCCRRPSLSFDLAL